MRHCVLADSGPLYALVDAADARHTRSQEQFAKLLAEQRTILIVASTLMEAHGLLLRRLGIDFARNWLQEAHDSTGIIHPTARDLGAATEVISGYRDQPLTLFDAVLGEISTRLETPVWTFDHHFDVMKVAVWR
jgi:predicted nucleic acid-binding protein